MAEVAVQERQEYERILSHQQAKQKEDEERARLALEARELQKTMLQKQIAEREELKREERRRFLDDGSRYSEQLEQDKTKLERIKQMKLAELEALGVPEKYRSELARKRILLTSIY